MNRNIAMCCTFSMFGCCGVLFLISVILMPLGAIALKEANSANPEEDFRALGSVCNVTGVQHCWETGRRTERHNGRDRDVDTCTDKYEYFFTVTDGSAELLYTYQSREERNMRDNDRSCGRTGSPSNTGCWDGSWQYDTSGAPAYRTYTPGATYQCWAPTAGNNRANLPSVYNCGDGASPAGDACVKLWDPQDEVDAAADAASGMLAGGIILLVFSIGFTIAGFICLNCYRQAGKAEAERRRQQVTAQPAVQMQTTVAMPPNQPMGYAGPSQPVAVACAAQPAAFGAQPVAYAAQPVAYAAQPVAYAAQPQPACSAAPVAQAMPVAQAQPMKG